MGAKFSSLLNRLMSAVESSREDKLKIFIVSGILVGWCLSLFRPPPVSPSGKFSFSPVGWRRTVN